MEYWLRWPCRNTKRAVEKARATEAITVLNTLQKAIDAYILEHGFPGDHVNFLGECHADYGTNHPLDIELTGIQCRQDIERNGYCYSKDFIYYAACGGNGCGIAAFRGTQEEWETNGNIWVLSNVLPEKYLLEKNLSRTLKWTKSCSGNCPSGLVW